MKFNHNSEKLTESFGIERTSQEVAELITDIVRRWMVSDSDKISMLGESLHNELPYEIILFLATQEVHGKMRSTLSDMTGELEKIVRRIIQDEEDRQAKMN